MNTRFVNNAVCHLFEEIRYEFNGIEIDRCKNVGLTTSMKSYVAYNFSQTVVLENAGSVDVGETATIADDAGNFDIFIPLRMILGFAEDYQKIIINAKHELVPLRSGSDLNAVIQTYAENNVLEGFKINLKIVEWLMHYVQLSNEYKI